MHVIAHPRRPVAVIVIALSCFVITSQAEEKADEKPPKAKSSTDKIATTTESDSAAKDATKAKPHVLPKGIEEVVRMSEAGVSTEILTKYIEGSGIAYEPTGADIIVMKRRGVSDDVTVVLLARSSKIREQYEAARKKIAAPAVVRTLATDGELDPESYEFFWYHHAYPRALASSYQTLAPYTQVSSGRRLNSGPKWRTDGFARESFAPGESVRRGRQPSKK